MRVHSSSGPWSEPIRAGSQLPMVSPDYDRRRFADTIVVSPSALDYPPKANHAWQQERGIAATIPERDDQIAHRRKKPGRPIEFGDRQQERFKGRNVVERCFNWLKQWRGIAMRSDKAARNYRVAICLAATLIWIKTDLVTLS